MVMLGGKTIPNSHSARRWGVLNRATSTPNVFRDSGLIFVSVLIEKKGLY